MIIILKKKDLEYLIVEQFYSILFFYDFLYFILKRLLSTGLSYVAHRCGQIPLGIGSQCESGRQVWAHSTSCGCSSRLPRNGGNPHQKRR